MTLTTTLVLFAFAVAFAVFCGWRGAQPPDLVRGPRMIPYRFVMAISALAALTLLVHLANLAGLHTGR